MTPERQPHFTFWNLGSQQLQVAVGSPGRVRDRLSAVLAETGADELILTAHIYDHATRLRSFELAAQAMCGADHAGRRPGEGRKVG